ncbi:MAG: dihydropteroate synthase [Planctomycetaceae bacterium]|nr:dihydropteroate synthase [Planctomycetaceae bacterium]
MPQEHIHFVTGRLAERALREQVAALAERIGFSYSVDVLPITVAALMTPAWIAKHWAVPPHTTRVVIPGYCGGDLTALHADCHATVEAGPRDLRQLPEFFLQSPPPEDYGGWDIEIIAEINFCPRLTTAEILETAEQLRQDGANVIDVGCEPGAPWSGVGDVVRALRDAGHRVSIDSMHVGEIAAATRAGAELVLSVNSTNVEAAADWGAEVVVVPDDPKDPAGCEATLDKLQAGGVACRIDPVLEPIGFGFAASLARYVESRKRYPDAAMMMGVGNLTELTDADSAAINVLLLGFCQELGIRSVLTTQVINWARTSVRECDRARRLAYHAVERGVLPKHLAPELVMLRDPHVDEPAPPDIAELAAAVRDNNYRIFAANGEVHVASRGLHLHHCDPFELMDQLARSGPGGGMPRGLDQRHAFYLGYEMCKAATALTLGKSYRQDEALNWGLLTRPESRRHLTSRRDIDAGSADDAAGRGEGEP